jgi:DNA-binding MarR family transcriptional regulator
LLSPFLTGRNQGVLQSKSQDHSAKKIQTMRPSQWPTPNGQQLFPVNETIVTTIIVVVLNMSLEKDIQQERFNNEFEKAAINILFTSGWLYNLNAARLKAFDITPEQFNVLRILRGSHPKAMMLADITCRMIDRSSNATRLVEKLRQKGLLKREICANNRRQVDISITDKGLNVLKKIDERETEWLSTLKNISKGEAQELNRMLDKLRG